MILDVSDFQYPDGSPIAWDKVKAYGQVQAVIAKATEGVTGYQSTFITSHNGCKANGIPFGAYHFFHPSDTAMAQASSFLKAIDGYEGQVLPMVDVEVTDGMSFAFLISRLSSFIDIVERTLGGKKMLFYSYWSFLTDNLKGYDGFAGHPLWIAEYSNATMPDVLGTGWADYTLWQHTDKGTVPGISGYVDQSTLNPSLTLEKILR